ncbi:hypothetical protein [Xanthomonas cannabis]|uniref:hypothetical protein n=1 Tax=Xanthomonas cannabis TaxID=1885674 RepID=UPI00141B0414|nr:hypothetical protein [Xanthomonas cannabis]NIK17152.1 hypothetical protein [Xanthomonas cannabis]
MRPHAGHCLRRLIGGAPNPHQQRIDPHVEPRRSDLDAAQQQPRRHAPEGVTAQIARTLFAAFEHQQWIDPHVEPRALMSTPRDSNRAAARRRACRLG